MTTDDDDENTGAIIIELPTLRDKPLLSHAKEHPTKRKCYVHSFVIDDDARVVTCRTCKSKFDPFDALVEVAAQWVTYGRQLKAYDGEIKQLCEQQVDLKREVQNLKAQRKRHAERLAFDTPGMPRCPALNVYRRQCTLPEGHDRGEEPTDHWEPSCNVGWRMPTSARTKQ